ncbi:MAG: tRNA pseudouridine(38-40) synthase TruA [Flavobacteriales bacterium]|nr:tRNA pseudouridine(38-40) synthase TruA [Flavobacteriales bacterium]
MFRYFIALQYDGSNYHGWQVQENAHSVQAEINQALSTFLQQDMMITGAGRTDTGVHARQMFAHFDLDQEVDTQLLQFKLNALLPFDIACDRVFPVPAETHARFSATSRTYEYWITKRKDPFLQNKAWYFSGDLDLELMNQGAAELLKHTDFSCFSKSHTDTYTNDCDLMFAEWKQTDDLLIFTIRANRFLRNMVRAIVGTLVTLGQHKISLNDLTTIVESKDRSNAGSSAPAHGLYLTAVDYPREVFHG